MKTVLISNKLKEFFTLKCHHQNEANIDNFQRYAFKLQTSLNSNHVFLTIKDGLVVFHFHTNILDYHIYKIHLRPSTKDL